MIVVMVAKVVVRGMMVVVVIGGGYGSGGGWELLSGFDESTVSWLPGVRGGHTVYTIWGNFSRTYLLTASAMVLGWEPSRKGRGHSLLIGWLIWTHYSVDCTGAYTFAFCSSNKCWFSLSVIVDFLKDANRDILFAESLIWEIWLGFHWYLGQSPCHR